MTEPYETKTVVPTEYFDKLTGEVDPASRKPGVSDSVHYVSHGTPVRADDTQAYRSECRAAIVTEVSDDPPAGAEHEIGLCVINPTGMFYQRGVDQHEVSADGDEVPGGGPHNHPGGTWHWPEQV